VTKIVNGAELKSRLASQGIMIETNSPADFARSIREENARWVKVIKEAGIKGE
jgi:tripartite-type tricarboxylate transporter receptor subunit TctC